MNKLEEGQLIFAPMEGVTNALYRSVIGKLYPEWDFYACDFLRVPSVGKYPVKHLLKHFGPKLYESELRDKTIYQILTSSGAKTKETVRDLNSLGFKWVDLNLGCPSKMVVKKKGGSYLLKAYDELEIILKEIRDNFDGFFSVKIRVGFEDDSVFEKNLRLFEKCGVEAITIHGRTRSQLYKGVANWDYFKTAVESVGIPIIGNGDIWSVKDIQSCYGQTGVQSLMLARGALKTPWLARSYYQNELEDRVLRSRDILHYFSTLQRVYAEHISDDKTLNFFKSLSRYIFDDSSSDRTSVQSLKSLALRAKNLSIFMDTLYSQLSK